MSYEDFVWFILSEEDKSNELSLEYWFRCVDLDCDGKLRPNEMLVRGAASFVVHEAISLITLAACYHCAASHSKLQCLLRSMPV